jgi:hypothetical protein
MKFVKFYANTFHTCGAYRQNSGRILAEFLLVFDGWTVTRHAKHKEAMKRYIKERTQSHIILVFRQIKNYSILIYSKPRQLSYYSD